MYTIGDKIVFSNGIDLNYMTVDSIKELPITDQMTGAIVGTMILINGKYSKKYIRPAMEWEKNKYY